MKKSVEPLDVWVEKYGATRDLKRNLKVNLDELTDLSREEKESLLRCHLIMIRQCLNRFGVV